jgi:hypothetical protein
VVGGWVVGCRVGIRVVPWSASTWELGKWEHVWGPELVLEKWGLVWGAELVLEKWGPVWGPVWACSWSIAALRRSSLWRSLVCSLWKH